MFYAGHGVQLGGLNYLVPVEDLDAETEESDIANDGIELSSLLQRVSRSQVAFSLAIVDACRNNPFVGRARTLGATRGLTAPVTTPQGFTVLYSAGAGETALDRLSASDTSPNGLFTRELLPVLSQSGLSVSDMLKKVRMSVITKAKAVGHDQHPALYDQSDGDYYLSAPQAAAVTPPAAAAPAARGGGERRGNRRRRGAGPVAVGAGARTSRASRPTWSSTRRAGSRG